MPANMSAVSIVSLVISIISMILCLRLIWKSMRNFNGDWSKQRCLRLSTSISIFIAVICLTIFTFYYIQSPLYLPVSSPKPECGSNQIFAAAIGIGFATFFPLSCVLVSLSHFYSINCVSYHNRQL